MRLRMAVPYPHGCSHANGMRQLRVIEAYALHMPHALVTNGALRSAPFEYMRGHVWPA